MQVPSENLIIPIKTLSHITFNKTSVLKPLQVYYQKHLIIDVSILILQYQYTH